MGRPQWRGTQLRVPAGSCWSGAAFAQSFLCHLNVDRARSLYRSFLCSKMGVIAVNYLPHGELINVCIPL